MKVAALNPHFVVETPPGAEKTEAARTAADLHLRVVKPEEPAPEETKVSLDNETRDALKRLSAFFKDKKKKMTNEEAARVAKELRERGKRRAFQRYRDIYERRDPREGQGENIDDYF